MELLFFSSARKDIAPLSASQRPTPSSLYLPLPPARTGFPGLALAAARGGRGQWRLLVGLVEGRGSGPAAVARVA